MHKLRQLVETRTISATETALALDFVSELDLLRLKTIARLHARALPPDVGWEDLLQEAITRVLVGSRRPPEGISMVGFLAGVMRSLKSDHWRRARSGGCNPTTVLRLDQPQESYREIDLLDPSIDLERALMAQQAVEAIYTLFLNDPLAQQIITGLAEGLSAEQIRSAQGISTTDYDSARRRMRRRLLREGLTCEPK
jgi:DNA-directed RNA polymerase specialized sigma24 family protein